MVGQVHGDPVEAVRDRRAGRAAGGVVGPEHEVVDEELRAPSEEVRQRGAPLVGLESILLVDPHPRQLLPPPRQVVAAPRELLLGPRAARAGLRATLYVSRFCASSSLLAPSCSPARARGYECVRSMIGRTSMHPRRAGGIFEATWMASFRSLASIR